MCSNDLLRSYRAADRLVVKIRHSSPGFPRGSPSWFARNKTSLHAAWINGLLARKPARLVAVALANKMARIAWAVLARQETYRAPAITA